MVRPTKARHNPLEAHAESADMRLSDLVIGTEFAVSALEVVVDNIGLWDDPVTIESPFSRGNLTKISRPLSEVEKILDEQIAHKQYEKSLVFAVAEAEDHIASYIRIVLRAYPERLARGPRGGPSEKSVAWDEIVKTDSKEALINSIIEGRINSVMHSRPSEYLNYLCRTIEGHLSEEVVNRFCELCATRDLIVHTQGKINAEYIEKANGLARGNIGDYAVVDKKYFQSAMNSIKNIYDEIYRIMEQKYCKDGKIDSVFSTMAMWDAYRKAIVSMTEPENSN